MSETMAARVAKNIAVADGNSLPAADYAIMARAAIEAMREPTFDPEKVSYHEGMTRADWWRSMIDAALATPAPERP